MQSTLTGSRGWGRRDPVFAGESPLQREGNVLPPPRRGETLGAAWAAVVCPRGAHVRDGRLRAARRLALPVPAASPSRPRRRAGGPCLAPHPGVAPGPRRALRVSGCAGQAALAARGGGVPGVRAAAPGPRPALPGTLLWQTAPRPRSSRTALSGEPWSGPVREPKLNQPSGSCPRRAALLVTRAAHTRDPDLSPIPYFQLPESFHCQDHGVPGTLAESGRLPFTQFGA